MILKQHNSSEISFDEGKVVVEAFRDYACSVEGSDHSPLLLSCLQKMIKVMYFVEEFRARHVRLLLANFPGAVQAKYDAVVKEAKVGQIYVNILADNFGNFRTRRRNATNRRKVGRPWMTKSSR